MESKITLPTNSSLPAILDTRNQTLALVEIIVQILILILALLGNSFVLYALWKQRKIRPWSRVYLFMAHLSFADLLVAIFNILPQLIWDITFRFRAGDLMCRCVKYLQVFVLYLSTYILVAMSIDRYLAIQSIQTGYCDTARTFRVMIAIAWLLSILFAVPQTVIFGLKEVKPNSGIYDCWATFAPNWDKVYVTWFVVSVFGIPLLVIIFCYGTICFKIWKYKPSSSNFIVHYATSVEEGAQISGDCQLPNDTSSPSQRKVKFIENDAVSSSHREHNSISRAKIKTIKLTLTVVICFFLCWSPFMGTQLILTFDPPTSGKGKIFKYLTLF